METLVWLKETLHIDPIIVLIVIASGFFQNTYLKMVNIVKDVKTNSALKTLLVSTIVVTIMLLFQKAKGLEIWEAFLSYFLATSLHELFIRPVTNYIKNHLSKLEEDDKSSDNSGKS